MSKAKLVCPYSGIACPGEERCAPAVFTAEHAREQGNEDVRPVCPISETVFNSRLIASALLGEDLVTREPAAPTTESLIDALQIDQEG